MLLDVTNQIKSHDTLPNKFVDAKRYNQHLILQNITNQHWITASY